MDTMDTMTIPFCLPLSRALVEVSAQRFAHADEDDEVLESSPS
jgi:hypothetical protein